MSYTKRELDILHIVEGLDISPTMYKNASYKYSSIAEFLTNNGIEADFYPQGSFALGTVVRPFKGDSDAGYDLDAICKVRESKNQISAEELFTNVANVFENSDRYKDKTTVSENCITIGYADVDEVAFSIDIVPAVDEERLYCMEQAKKLKRDDLTSTIIAIPEKKESGYDWFPNNPKGYKQWFNEKNSRFMPYAIDNKQLLFEANRELYSSVEEVPDALLRTSMQRVIKILKRSRDLYYSNIDPDTIEKPISAIINTLVAQFASNVSPSSSVFELLRMIIDQLNELKKKSNDRECLLSKQGETWVLSNPALPEDNLADGWTDDHADMFFNWVLSLTDDFSGYGNVPDTVFRSKVENIFGVDAVNRVIKNKYCSESPTVFTQHNSSRPWKNNDGIHSRF